MLIDDIRTICHYLSIILVGLSLFIVIISAKCNVGDPETVKQVSKSFKILTITILSLVIYLLSSQIFGSH